MGEKNRGERREIERNDTGRKAKEREREGGDIYIYIKRERERERKRETGRGSTRVQAVRHRNCGRRSRDTYIMYTR